MLKWHSVERKCRSLVTEFSFLSTKINLMLLILLRIFSYDGMDRICEKINSNYTKHKFYYLLNEQKNERSRNENEKKNADSVCLNYQLMLKLRTIVSCGKMLDSTLYKVPIEQTRLFILHRTSEKSADCFCGIITIFCLQ